MQRRSNVIGLVLQPTIVVVAVGRQVLVADFFTIQCGFIQPKPADVQPRGDHIVTGQGLAKHGMARFGVVTGNPLGLLRFFLLGGFKPICFACDFLIGVGAYRDAPVIPRARFCGKLHGGGKRMPHLVKRPS